jgi:hypothetical protein
MKNITITLDEKTATWAKLQAARNDMSLSRFVAELLNRTMGESREYEAAMRRFLVKQPSKLRDPAAAYPSRDEINDRRNFR